MRRMFKLLLATCIFLPAPFLLADQIPYPNKGNVAPFTPTYASSSNGVGIDLYYYGSSAGYNDTIQVFDVQTGYKSGQIMANHATAPGTEDVVGQGQINAGDEIVFYLSSPAGVFASDPAYSPDGLSHTYVTIYSGGVIGTTKVPAGLFLGFEDEPSTKSDLDYNDLEVIATGVSTSVTPEPASLALFGTGILGLAGAVRRRLA